MGRSNLKQRLNIYTIKPTLLLSSAIGLLETFSLLGVFWPFFWEFFGPYFTWVRFLICGGVSPLLLTPPTYHPFCLPTALSKLHIPSTVHPL